MAAIFSLALAGCHKAQPVAGTNPPAQSPPAVSLMVSVGNAGFPSTVQGWSLDVSSLGQAFTSVGPVHINGVVDAPGKLRTKIDLDKEDLAVKTAQDPVGIVT